MLYKTWHTLRSTCNECHAQIYSIFCETELTSKCWNIPQWFLTNQFLHLHFWIPNCKCKRYKPNTICDSVALCFPSPSHSLLYVGSSSTSYRYAPQCIRILLLDAFYMLPIAFSPLQAVEIVPVSYRVRSAREEEQYFDM